MFPSELISVEILSKGFQISAFCRLNIKCDRTSSHSKKCETNAPQVFLELFGGEKTADELMLG